MVPGVYGSVNHPLPADGGDTILNFRFMNVEAPGCPQSQTSWVMLQSDEMLFPAEMMTLSLGPFICFMNIQLFQGTFVALPVPCSVSLRTCR